MQIMHPDRYNFIDNNYEELLPLYQPEFRETIREYRPLVPYPEVRDYYGIDPATRIPEIIHDFAHHAYIEPEPMEQRRLEPWHHAHLLQLERPRAEELPNRRLAAEYFQNIERRAGRYDELGPGRGLAQLHFERPEQIARFGREREMLELAFQNIVYDPNIIDDRDERERLLAGMALANAAFAKTRDLRHDISNREKPQLDNPAWLAANVAYKPRGWNMKRIGSILKSRFALGVDTRLEHSAELLRAFECPEEVAGVALHSKDKETKLVLAALFGQNPDKLPARANRVNKLFFNQDLGDIYMSLTNDEYSQLTLEEKIAQLVPAEMKELREAITLAEKFGFQITDKDQAQTIAELKQMSKAREMFINDAQKWLQNHATTPRDILIEAWQNRRQALTAGAEDNPRAIKAWKDANKVFVAFREMEERGIAPENLNAEDLAKMQPYITEMARFYREETIISTLSMHKEYFNPQAILTPYKQQLSNGWTAEVLEKDDPRGYTLGAESGCCMKINGLGETCIEAGYSDPRYGFFALYNEKGQLVGQSLLYTSPDVAPNTLVIDNIETSRGFNRSDLVGVYTEALSRYAEQYNQTATRPIKEVNLGVHAIEIYDNRLKAVKPVLTPNATIYTDADRHQLRLITMESQPLEQGFLPMCVSDWQDVNRIAREIYGGKDDAYDVDMNKLSSDEHVGVHSYWLSSADGEERNGYVIAYVDTMVQDWDGQGEELAKQVLYIDDLVVLPAAQKQGVGRKALLFMLAKAKELGKPVVFHAKDDTSWAALSSHREALAEAGYEMQVLEHDPSYHSDDIGAHLVLIKPNDA